MAQVRYSIICQPLLLKLNLRRDYYFGEGWRVKGAAGRLSAELIPDG